MKTKDHIMPLVNGWQHISLIGVCATSVFNASQGMSVDSCFFLYVVIKTHQIVHTPIGVLTSLTLGHKETYGRVLLP